MHHDEQFAQREHCINCHANGLIEQNTMPNIMKRFFAECSLVLGDMNELESTFNGDMGAFVSHLIVKLLDKKFAKEMSQIRGITLDRDAFADYFRSGNGKQLWVDKLSYIVTHSDGTKELEKDKIPRMAPLRKRCIRFVDALVRSSVKRRHTEFSPPTTKKSWEMDWRPSSGSSTSYPTSRGCQSGEMLPTPTNAGSHFPEVRQGEHDHSHDGPRQEEKWHCEVRSRGSQFHTRKERQASPVVRTRMIVVVNPIMPKSLSRVGDIATRRAELWQRTGELNVCIMCGKESHEGTCKDITRATESDLARGKIQMLLPGHRALILTNNFRPLLKQHFVQ